MGTMVSMVVGICLVAVTAGVAVAQPVAAPGGPYTGTAEQPITFSGIGSTDPGGAIVSYLWDFGDTFGRGIGPTPRHAYSAPGTYTVTLTVTGTGGLTAVGTTQAVVTAPPPPQGVTAFVPVPVRIQWTNPAVPLGGFHLQRSHDGGATWQAVATVGPGLRQYVDTVSSGTYEYRIQSFFTTTVSDWSPPVTVVVP